jgi:hypothetical protein
MCFPRVSNNLQVNGQKAIIFEHIASGLMDKGYLDYYLSHIISEVARDRSTQLNHDDFVAEFYANVMVVQYCDLDDLMIKIHSLSYVLTSESIKLVILDSANITIEQNIVNTYEGGNDDLRPRRTTFDMDNKARRSINDTETRIYMNVFTVLNSFQNKYNFGIVNLYYDFERYPFYTSIGFKMNRSPFYNISMENDPCVFHFKYDFDDDRIEFIIRITLDNLKDRFNVIAPMSKTDQFFSDYKPFGILSLECDRVMFKVFIYSYTHQNLNQIAEESIPLENLVPQVRRNS